MKSLWISILFAISLPVFADDLSDAGTVSFRLHKPESVDFNKSNFSEVGFLMNSINNGTRFANLSVGHDFDNGFTLGARGLVPVDYSKTAQSYIGQVFGRFPLKNDVNVIYFELSGSMGVFSNAETEEISSTNTMFYMAGLSYGYARRFANDFSAGLSLGVDWSDARMNKDQIVSRSTLVNHVALTGGYYF